MKLERLEITFTIDGEEYHTVVRNIDRDLSSITRDDIKRIVRRLTNRRLNQLADTLPPETKEEPAFE